ncbi:MAG: hypothetical protein R2699_04905 [Acidimicrobiales bacterium]
MTLDVAALADGVRRGDRRSLAKAITLVESARHDHRGQADLLDALLGATGASVRIGISGSPGVGKSTFIEAFGLHLRHRAPGGGACRRPVVVAVGRSILGDKTRMGELAADPEVFVRPRPAAVTSVGSPDAPARRCCCARRRASTW